MAAKSLLVLLCQQKAPQCYSKTQLAGGQSGLQLDSHPELHLLPTSAVLTMPSAIGVLSVPKHATVGAASPVSDVQGAAADGSFSPGC